jgi:uncharacterized protein YbjT (DUF2867 family)
MRCLVTGAYGFIGREIVAALQAEGWSVTGAGRDLALGRRLIPGIEWVACDFNHDLEVAQWMPRLAGIDAVINCVGVLQASLGDDPDRIHADATVALFNACAAVGVKRLVHLSAVGAEAEMDTQYARSKAKADAALAKIDLNWLIVKPSLVVGRGSFGGTSLMRGLAGLPFVLPLPGKAKERFQPIAARDLARGIAKLAAVEEPVRTTLYAAGPETVSVREILVAYRAWLGFPKARVIETPLPLLRLLLRLGDIAGWVGYPTSARTTSLRQMRQDLLVDGAGFAQAAGEPLKSFSQTLTASPATLQDRLHARCFFAVPLLHICIAAFWIFTGLLTLTPKSYAAATALITSHGYSQGLAAAFVTAGSTVDIVLGVLFLLPGWVRRAGVAQLLVSVFYAVGLSVLAPELWSDHFGPLLKIAPLMAATLVVMAYQESR